MNYINCAICGRAMGLNEIKEFIEIQKGYGSAICDKCKNIKKLDTGELLIREIEQKVRDDREELLKPLGILTSCKRCGQTIFFAMTKNGKQMPVTLELKSHFADCKFANDFRKAKDESKKS